MSPVKSAAAEAVTAARRAVPSDVAALPVLIMCSGLGILVCAGANAMSRATVTSSHALYFLGILLIVVPTVFRLTAEAPSPRERLATVVLFGLSLYAVKVVRDPMLFTFPDEPIHSFNAGQIVANHQLFNHNSISPVTTTYPGLSGAASAVMTLTGMSSYGAGILVVGAARLTFVIGLFILFSRVTGSPRAAGLGVAVYAGNSNFLFWGGQFAYESLALPLLVVVLATFVEREAASSEPETERGRASRRPPVAWALLIAFLISAIVVTHHLTSYVVIVTFLLLAAIYRAERLPRRNPWPFAAFALVAALFWLIVVAPSTVSYLSPVLTNAFNATINTASGESAPRTLFHSSTSAGAVPLVARLIALCGVVLLLLGFLAGIRKAWSRRRSQPLSLVFAIAGAGFFGALALRFAPAAWETGNRAGEFLFIGLAFVVALGATTLLRAGPDLQRRRLAVTLAATVVFVGGAISGWPWDAQLTRPLRITAKGHEIDSEPLALALWAGRHLTHGRFAAADADARLLMSPGQVEALTGDSLDVKYILSAPRLEGWELPLLAGHHVRYLVADRRALATDNVRGYYFAEKGADQSLVPLAAMHKFAAIPAARIYDSGRIVVYDLADRP